MLMSVARVCPVIRSTIVSAMIWSRVRQSPPATAGISVVPECGVAGDALFDQEIAGEQGHGVWCRPDADAAMRAFGAAPLRIAVAIRLVGDPSDASRRRLEPQLGNAGGDDLLVDVPPRSCGSRCRVPVTTCSAISSLNSPLVSWR